MLNFLDEPLITAVSNHDVRCRYSLPGVIAGLVRGSIVSFARLRTHQRHIWHAFLVQVATLALERAGEGTLPDGEGSWRELIAGLTPEYPEGEPWSLVVSDLLKPALLQSPIPNRSLPEFRVIETPDKLDMLVTSKNHDLKAERMRKSSPEDWLFALLSLQTQEGIMGSGKYGISRMNGGYGSRAMFGIDMSGNPGFRFRHDVALLLSLATEDHNPIGLHLAGQALLWLLSWDGAQSIAIEKLHPHYIEICRRVRLGAAGEQIFALEAGSAGPRISGASDLKGNTGDPWTPISVEGKAFSMNREGFSYRKLAEVLNPSKFQLPPLAILYGNDPAEGVEFVMESVCRGQGKTEGYHERRIPISKAARSSILQDQGTLVEIINKRIAVISEVRTAFRFGLLTLLQGGTNKVIIEREAPKKYAEQWLERFERGVDGRFFDDLWDEVGALESDRAEIHTTWLRTQLGFAQSLLSEASQVFPYLSTRRYHARAQAGITFGAKLSKSLRIHLHLNRQKPEEGSRAAY
jgi:CRISPR system Cascade subunit CasA